MRLMMPRLTVRLSDGLYDRLLVYAKGRNPGRQELAIIVREALESYLSPDVRLPKTLTRQTQRRPKTQT
jgi:hypothetical protein